MKRKESIVITAVFALFMVGLLLATLLSEKPDFSEWENRPLASFPEANAETVFSGEFGKDFETWLTDRFAARDFWVKFKRISDSALGIREAGGVAVGNNALFDIPDPANTKAVDKNILAINTFAEKTELPVSVMLVPSAATVFPDSTPSLFPSTGEENTVSDIYSRLGEGVKTVDVIKPLRTMNYDDAFYKTDHHWTSMGAACAYAEWIDNGNSYAAKTVAENFYGTLASRSGDIFTEPDTIKEITSGDRFVSCEVFDGKSVTEYPSMYFEEYLEVKDKYSYFLGSNQPLVTLETENTTGKVLLVFKDSFAHSFIQCAAVDFDKVILVDLRYVTSPVNTLVNLSEVTDVLFLYSVENFTTQDNMMWIK